MAYEVLIIGGGRWGQVYLKELIKLRSELKINITISTEFNFNYLKTKFNYKSVCVRRRSGLVHDNKLYDLAIICTSEESHYTSIMDTLKINVKKILVEKPFLQNLNEYTGIKKMMEWEPNKIYISCPYIYTKVVSEHEKKIINVLKIESHWHEQTCNKMGYKQDKCVYMTAASHLLPILFLITRYSYDNYKVVEKNENKLLIKNNQKLLEMNCSRTSRQSVRKSIILKTSESSTTIDLESKDNKESGIKAVLNIALSPLQSQVISLLMDVNNSITEYTDYINYRKLESVLTLE